VLDSKLAAPQGFEPRYADPEAREAGDSAESPRFLLITEEIPFFSVCCSVPGSAESHRRQSYDNQEKHVKQIEMLPVFVTGFLCARYADFLPA